MKTIEFIDKTRLRTEKKYVLVVILFLFLVGATLDPANGQDKTIEVRTGIWKSPGAEIIVINREDYQSYFLTSISCVPTGSGMAADVVKLYPQIESWSADAMVVSGNDWRDTYRRLTKLPEPCQLTPDTKDALFNFDVFCQYFQENYPSFRVRGIDWEAMRRDYRTRVRSGMSEKELIAVLGEMVEKINDPHVFITNAKPGAENISYASPEAHGLAAAVREALPGKTTNIYRNTADRIEQSIETLIRYELLAGKFKTAHNERLLWGMLTTNVGYLRSSQSMGLFPPGTSREQMYLQLDTTLDNIFTDLKNARALIIDVTMNTGGASFIADKIAGRIVRKKTFAYQARLMTVSGLAEPFTKTLVPTPRPRFSGPVVVLISSNTVSAGESFPLILGGLPNVTLYGEKTLGAISSYMMMKLPNGWRVGVPNYVITDRKGKWYEGQGIPPDIRATVFNPKKLVSGYLDFVSSAVKLARIKIQGKRPLP
jgi:hypothetical protein